MGIDGGSGSFGRPPIGRVTLDGREWEIAALSVARPVAGGPILCRYELVASDDGRGCQLTIALEVGRGLRETMSPPPAADPRDPPPRYPPGVWRSSHGI